MVTRSDDRGDRVGFLRMKVWGLTVVAEVKSQASTGLSAQLLLNGSGLIKCYSPGVELPAVDLILTMKTSLGFVCLFVFVFTSLLEYNCFTMLC